MSYTIKYAYSAAAWFILVPSIAITMFSQEMPLDSLSVSVLWVGGLCVFFYLWASRDAMIYQVTKRSVMWFSAASIAIPIVVVIPYLYFSRGLSRGSIAAVKYLIFCVACWSGLALIVMVSNFVT